VLRTLFACHLGEKPWRACKEPLLRLTNRELVRDTNIVRSRPLRCLAALSRYQGSDRRSIFLRCETGANSPQQHDKPRAALELTPACLPNIDLSRIAQTCLSGGLMLFLHLPTKLFLQISSKSSRGYQLLLVSSGFLISTRVMRALAIGSIHPTSSGSLQKAVSHTTRNLLASVGNSPLHRACLLRCP
jgi:hypothetical protein